MKSLPLKEAAAKKANTTSARKAASGTRGKENQHPETASSVSTSTPASPAASGADVLATISVEDDLRADLKITQCKYISLFVLLFCLILCLYIFSSARQG